MAKLTNHQLRSRWLTMMSMFLIAIIAAVLIDPIGIGTSSASPSSAIAPAASVAQEATPVVDATPVDTADTYDCEIVAPGVGSEPWVRSELYFGVPLETSGEMLTDEEFQDFLDTEWQDFLDTEITPRFPDGLTVLTGYGQYLNSSNVITQEDSIVLIIFLPLDAVPEASASIEEIREAYKTEFEQESVLRVDAEPVCVSF